MSRFSPRISSLPQQEISSRDKFVVNLAHGARYYRSAIVNCQRHMEEGGGRREEGRREEGNTLIFDKIFMIATILN